MKLENIKEILQTNLKYNPKTVYILPLLWGFIIYCIIFFIRPFGISDEDTLFLFKTALSLSISSAFLFYVNLILIKKNKFKKIKFSWNPIHEFLFLLFVTIQISVLDTYIISIILNMMELSLSTFIRIFTYVVILHLPLILFQIVLSIFMVYQNEMIILRTKNEYLKEIQNLKSEVDNNKEQISLHVENEKMSLNQNNLISISSYGNYLKFFINSHSNVVEIVKRDSLTSIESQLKSYNEFIRCHRSHIININYIKKISGTSKKAEAQLSTGNISVPIARSSIKTVIDIFQNKDIS